MLLPVRFLACDFRPVGVLIIVVAAVAGLATYSISLAQTPPFQQISTEERLRRPGWWPTKGTAAREEFVGPVVCAHCHSSIATSQAQHNMARTLVRASESDVLHAAIGSTFRLGSFQYQITQSPDGTVSSSVADATHSISDRLAWAFGSGAVGQSLLFEREGALYETRFSLFPNAKTIDTTPNQRQWVARTLEQAAGRRLGEPEARRCFGCHSTAAVTKGRLAADQAIPGVTCEGCHGPGAIHVAMMKSGMEQATMEIVNPAHMTPADAVDFCGACHGTSWDVVLSGSTGVENVRFPAYRLQKSRCWGEGNSRLVCAACHDPHQPLARDSASYDANCLSCHVSAGVRTTTEHPGPACKVAAKDCAGCHMQKYELREMHAKYTDHYIRIVRDPAVFPDGPPDVRPAANRSSKAHGTTEPR
jgi:hypothetical protein